jgi:hypothetical protein
MPPRPAKETSKEIRLRGLEMSKCWWNPAARGNVWDSEQPELFDWAAPLQYISSHVRQYHLRGTIPVKKGNL